MLVKGDKVKMVKAIPSFKRVGEVFEVVDIAEDGVITIKTYCGIGIMSYKEFEKYFELVERIQWENLIDYLTVTCKTEMPYGIVFVPTGSISKMTDLFIGNIKDVEIKTDKEKTVKLKYKNYITEANLHPNDKFDLHKGIEICLCRLNEIINRKMLRSLEK